MLAPPSLLAFHHGSHSLPFIDAAVTTRRSSGEQVITDQEDLDLH
jgi:hypothetical protein